MPPDTWLSRFRGQQHSFAQAQGHATTEAYIVYVALHPSVLVGRVVGWFLVLFLAVGLLSQHAGLAHFPRFSVHTVHQNGAFALHL